MSDVDQDEYFADKIKYDDFISGRDTDFADIFPDRAEVGSVYKMITSSPQNIERLKSINTENGYAKTQIAINALCELGLISENNGILVGNNPGQKTDLLNSKTYKKLYERVNGCE
jgi:ssDNA-specific exonuclease RecJ